MPANRLTRRLFTAGLLASAALPAQAAPRRYELIEDKARVAFRFQLSGAPQTGTVPVSNADIRVDIRKLANSSADVTADLRGVRTGFLFITQALLSAEVLDAANHPNVRFRSTRIRLGAQGRISEGAKIEGDLTLRGVTRPMVFDARLARPPGTAVSDLSRLLVSLSGRLDRRDFGAVGYPNLVAPEVELEIEAEIRETA